MRELYHFATLRVLAPVRVLCYNYEKLIDRKYMERTLIIFKPDAVMRGIVGEVLTRFEKAGFKGCGVGKQHNGLYESKRLAGFLLFHLHRFYGIRVWYW